jgi:flagellar protein FlgJ
MAAIDTTTQGLAGDARALDALRSRAATDPKAAVREAAKQFESLFMNELVKSMRASTLPSGLLDGGGASSALGTDMLDTQLASKMSGLPGGLSDAIMKQLERQMGMSPGPIPATGSANNTPAPLAAAPAATRIPQSGAAGFVQQHTEAARAAEAETGIPASFMVSQAALETGWGRKEIRNADGTPSYNLFGIKAGPGWKGAVTEVPTTEYVNGKAQKVTAKFRAYASYAESFADYAKLMKEGPRYQKAVAQASSAAGSTTGSAAGSTTDSATGSTGGGGRRVAQADPGAAFAQGLQRAGYATDPSYADKLTRVINTTLRLQRSLA